MTLTDLLILAYFIALAGLILFTIGRAHYGWKPLLILLVLSGAALMVIYPGRYGPEDRLKRGLDLAGGTTLVYEVRLAEDASADEVIPNLISVLRDRVDPQGVRNLSWRQIAGNRIEIQMPLAPPETQALRRQYAEAREALLDQSVTADRLNRALRAEAGAQRQQEIDQLAPEGSELRAELQELVEAYDAFIAASEPYEQTQQALREAERQLEQLPDDAPQEQRDELQAEVERLEQQIDAEARAYLEARRQYEQQRERVLARELSPLELDRALEASTEPYQPNQPSPRDEAMRRLIDAHPQRADAIERVFELHAAYEQRKGPLDSPEDLIAMLRGSGILEFRIAATPGEEPQNAQEYRQQLEEQGPRAGRTRPWRWFPIDDVDQFAADREEKEQLADNPEAFFTNYGLVGQEYGGEYYVLLANTDALALTRDDPDWELTNAYRTTDQLGGSALGFSLNAPGGRMMGQLTGPNQGKPMAILLDNQVISAPNLRSRITDSGQITGGAGGFTEQELNYLLRTLQAGSAAAELAEQPSMVKTTGPSLGEDNLRAGMEAAVLSLIVVGLFMLVYYFFAGAVANFALVANMILILGIMAMFQATFTLPGIAGIVLTIGMAVDANVLIFERIREERERNVDLPTSVRLGFEKALSTIVDANVTTLITCVVLYYFATAEIKGFAVTLLIGILATLFTALFCTRTIMELYLRWGSARELHMLPTIVPAIRRALSPNIDWIGKRYAFFTISAVLVVGGLTLVYSRGQTLLDIEFRSGTQVGVELAEDETLSIAEARDRLTVHAEVADAIAAGDLTEPGQLPQSLRDRHPDYDLDEVFRDMQPIVAEHTRASAEPIDFTHLRGDDATVVTTGTMQGMQATGFSISTLITDNDLVSETVQAAFEDKLETTRPIAFAGEDAQDVGQAPVFPIRHSELGQNIDRFGGATDYNVSDYLGGVAIVLENMNPAPTLEELRQRLRRTSMQPEFEGLGYRRHDVFGLERAADTTGDEPRYATAVVVARDDATDYVEQPDTFTASEGLAQTQWELVSTALQRGSSLASVSNFSSQVSQTMQQQAISALILALLGVVAYIWFRFGSIHYGLAAIVALVHDVIIALGLLALAGYVYDTWFGGLLLLDAFKINLAIVAAMLTIVGYSLNDTIVVFDRIRENRGRLAVATPGIINDSINQTISRTALTSGTTLIAVGILYIFGGSGIHGFAFAVLVGVIIGTYSSIAVGAPILLLGRAHRQAAAREAERKAKETSATPATS
ncbi:MAG: protein translocase subunit SecD [Phycisphaeraceae bacterium]